MSTLIDLSYDIVDNMDVHPYDSKAILQQDRYLEEDKYNNYRLEIGLHTGTHIDTPMHLTHDRTFINEIPLERFIGKGCILDVRNESIIRFKEEYVDKVQEGDIVLLFTNHSQTYGTKEYFINYPIVHSELAEFFVSKKIKMLGVDSPSPDQYPFEIHKKLLSHDILLIENLTNLSPLLTVDNFEIIAFPLKVRADASISRVVARYK